MLRDLSLRLSNPAFSDATDFTENQFLPPSIQNQMKYGSAYVCCVDDGLTDTENFSLDHETQPDNNSLPKRNPLIRLLSFGTKEFFSYMFGNDQKGFYVGSDYGYQLGDPTLGSRQNPDSTSLHNFVSTIPITPPYDAKRIGLKFIDTFLAAIFHGLAPASVHNLFAEQSNPTITLALAAIFTSPIILGNFYDVVFHNRVASLQKELREDQNTKIFYATPDQYQHNVDQFNLLKKAFLKTQLRTQRQELLLFLILFDDDIALNFLKEIVLNEKYSFETRAVVLFDLGHRRSDASQKALEEILQLTSNQKIKDATKRAFDVI